MPIQIEVPSTPQTRQSRTQHFSRPVPEALHWRELQALKDNMAPRPLTPEEQATLTKETFQKLFEKPQTHHLEELHSDRIKAAYRIIREFAHTKRLINQDEPLLTLAHQNPMAWEMPTENLSLYNTLSYLYEPDPTTNPYLITIFEKATRLTPNYWCWYEKLTPTHTPPEDPTFFTSRPPQTNGPDHTTEEPTFYTAPGMPLLPPPVPRPFLTNTQPPEVTDLYDPYTTDPNLSLYCKAVDSTARHLGIHNGTIKDPDRGIRALTGLTSPMHIRSVFPTALELISWEYILIVQTLNILITKGNMHAYNFLMKGHGYQHKEANGTIRMVKAFAKNLVHADRSEDRALMILRCENIVTRSAEALDLKAEMNAMKQMSHILGLTRTEEDETMDDFVAVVRQHTNNRLQGVPQKALE